MNRTTRTYPGRQPGNRGHRIPLLLPILAIAGALAVASCSTDFPDDEARSEQPIRIMAGAADPTMVQSYSPNPVTIVVRTEVVWFNDDSVAHQVVSVGGLFGTTESIPPGGQYRHIFLDRGTYRYYCTVAGHREAGVVNVLP
jgi:plastocyanin